MTTPSQADGSVSFECKSCGAAITPTAKFCLECGAAQATQPGDVVESQVPSAKSPSLSEATRLSSDNGGRRPTSQPRSLASNRLFWSAIAVAIIAVVSVGTWLWMVKHPMTAKGQYELGLKYENGDGVPRDYLQAASWYRKAADQGDANAQKRLNQNDTMPSPCDMRLTEAQMRLIPQNAQALNSSIEDVHKYITPEIAAYATKQAWSDYQTETHLSHDKVCLAEWIAFVQGNQPSVLKNAGVPILPDESLSQINDAMQLCSAGLGAESECKDLGKDSVSKHRIEANFLAIEWIHTPSDVPGEVTFKLTTRSTRSSLFNVYVPLLIKDKEHNFSQKGKELSIARLQPGGSVTATMTDVPGFRDAIKDFYKANNINAPSNLDVEFGSVSFKIQGDSQPSEFPFNWFDGSL